MERYSMQNRCTSRSYRQTPCNQPRPVQNHPLNGDCFDDTNLYKHADHLPLTMAYVPMQHFSCTFSLQKGLSCGTIFPELCKPFCGKGGGCRR